MQPRNQVIQAVQPAWTEVVVVMAATSWDGIWQSERHLALQLSRSIPVVWVDPAISWLTPLRNRKALKALREPRARLVGHNLLRVSSVTAPGVTRPVLRELALRQTRSQVRRTVRQLGVRVRATIVASLDDVLNIVPTGRTLLYGTDDFVAGAELSGVDRGWLERRERDQLARADQVIAVSPILRDKWAAWRSDVEVVPNGCDWEHLAATDRAPVPTDVRLPAPIAGFVGHLSERIDLALLEAVAERGVSLLLVGPRQPTFELRRIQTLLARDNVQWVGPKPFEALPSYLRVIDVGLTPYSRSDFNLASFPLKTLEYLAAGRPVIATDLPSARWLETDFVTIAGTPDSFATGAIHALGTPRTAGGVAERQAFAEQHSWARRAQDIARLLDLPASTECTIREEQPR